jgi:hypothetical protein
MTRQLIGPHGSRCARHGSFMQLLAFTAGLAAAWPAMGGYFISEVWRSDVRRDQPPAIEISDRRGANPASLQLVVADAFQSDHPLKAMVQITDPPPVNGAHVVAEADTPIQGLGQAYSPDQKVASLALSDGSAGSWEQQRSLLLLSGVGDEKEGLDLKMHRALGQSNTQDVLAGATLHDAVTFGVNAASLDQAHPALPGLSFAEVKTPFATAAEPRLDLVAGELVYRVPSEAGPAAGGFATGALDDVGRLTDLTTGAVYGVEPGSLNGAPLLAPEPHTLAYLAATGLVLVLARWHSRLARRGRP